MRTLHLLLSVLLVAPFALQAQPDQRTGGPFGRIYRLSDAEAATLYATEAATPLQEAWLHSPIDTFHGASPVRPLGPGHYLCIRAVEESVSTELLSYNSLRVWIQPHHRDLYVLVADSSGRMLGDAKVRLSGRDVPYDPVLHCYRLSRRLEAGLLQVQAQGETWFGRVDDRIQKPLWMRWLAYHSSFGAGKVLASPLRWGRRAYYRGRTLVVRRYRRYRPYRSAPEFSGYIAFSKPKYQPGDTLHVKAYVANHKGRPWRKPLELIIRETRGQHKEVLKQSLRPVTPGAFVFQWPLTDTLTLDTYYEVSLHEKSNSPRRDRYVSQRFNYEDYQLDEITYTLEPEKPEFQQGEPAVLRLSAKDANGQPAPDAAVRLVLTTVQPLGFHAAEVETPDTLWQHRQDFSTRGETTVVVPDSIWPPADLKVAVQAYCTNSAGELQVKQTIFDLFRQPDRLKTRVDAGYLFAERVKPADGPDSIWVQEVYDQNKTVERRIALPWKQALSADVSGYVFRSGDQSIEAELPDASEAVTLLAVRQPDTVLLGLLNPHRLPVRYQVFDQQAELEQGTTTDSVWTWVSGTKQGHSYRIACQFLWRGKMEKNSAVAQYYDRLLNIQVDQPEQVTPGATIQVKIRVEDARQRPARGVNLAAGAYNSQFAGGAPYTAPDIQYRPSRWAFVRHDFSLYKVKKQVLPTPVTPRWYERLDLDSVLFYRLRYRGKGLYSEYLPIAGDPDAAVPADHPGRSWDLPEEADSLYWRRPQFAPYIIRGNQAQPVYLIYCNSRPVYYHGQSGLQRYSFYGWYGYNQIKIRTRGGEYTLDSVYLEAGKKLEIALDGDLYKQAPKPVKVRFEPRPDTLTYFEQELLRNAMLQWRPAFPNTVHYFWSDATDIQVAVATGGAPLILGPFAPGMQLHYLHQGDFYSTFSFEPGFEYSISKGRERLWSSTWPAGRTRLPKTLPLKTPGELAWGPQHILPQVRLATVFPTQSPGADRPGKASLQLSLSTPDSCTLLALQGDTLLGPFNPRQARFDNLLPGRYRLLLYRADSMLYHRTVMLRRDTLLFLDLRAAEFQAVPPELSPFQLFSSSKIKSSTSQINPPPSQFSQWPGVSFRGSGVRGILTDDTGEALIGATVMAYQNGIFVGGTITDYNGEYHLGLPPGRYDLTFQYTGYTSTSIAGVRVDRSGNTVLDEQLKAGALLSEVVVTAYKVPLIRQDMTSAGMTLTSDQIVNLPTRSVQAIIATTAGLVDIKGSRADSVNYYVDGIRLNNGPLYLYDRAEFAGGKPEEAPEPVTLRSQFKDNAYWQPNLITDDRGEACFQVTFPDNITAWSTFALGMDRRRRAGVATQTTRSYKPLLARLALPRFAVAGDRFEAAGLANNLSGDSLDIRTAFRQGDQLLRENRVRIGEGLSEFVSVQTPAAGADSLTLSYETQSAGLSDGEQRSIAIEPVGTRETSGAFWVLEHDTAFTLQFDPALGPVTVQAQNNALDLLFEEVEYLRQYPYGCNEQTAGRLIGLLIEKNLAEAGYAPAIGRDRRKSEAQREKEINACLDRLRQGQWAEGSWGWWPGAAPNGWMTLYVLRALQLARQQGYATAAWDKGLIWLRQQLSGFPPAEQRDALIFLRSADVQFDCSPFLKGLDSLPRPTLQERLSHWRLQQLCGQPLPIDSLRPLLKPTTLGGYYCGDESNHWYNRRALNTLLAYDLATQARWDSIARGIRRYWLESRPANQLRNTIETAEIVQRLWPTLLAENDSLRNNRLDVNGVSTAEFPQKWNLPEGVASISIRKTGATELYLNAWQQWHNPAPAPRSDLFSVQSHLEQGGHRVDTLRRGEAAELVVQVRVQQAAEYVLLEMPIPAACSYGEKRQPYMPEVHREYFRDRVAAFCEQLPVGDYEFRVPLEPRFNGQFTLNPVRVEQMYFPVFYGRNGVQQVTVDGR